MTIFGVALLAICTLIGVFIGDLLGVALQVKANVGGVVSGTITFTTAVREAIDPSALLTVTEYSPESAASALSRNNVAAVAPSRTWPLNFH